MRVYLRTPSCEAALCPACWSSPRGRAPAAPPLPPQPRSACRSRAGSRRALRERPRPGAPRRRAVRTSSPPSLGLWSTRASLCCERSARARTRRQSRAAPRAP
eukprot:scaffold36783_cov68-Phaeocystis_antarctica.AAC.6